MLSAIRAVRFIIAVPFVALAAIILIVAYTILYMAMLFASFSTAEANSEFRQFLRSD